MWRGGGSDLKFIFHIKDEKVRTFDHCLIPLYINTDIVYVNGYAAHFMPLSPLKDQKSSRASKTPIYCMVGSYCITLFPFYFIMSVIVFFFVCFLDTSSILKVLSI